MSLARDYHNYYVGTWIALHEGDLNIPIFVEHIEDPSGFDSDDFSEEHRRELLFCGTRYDKHTNGRIRGSHITISVMDNSLELESPDVGYVNIGRDVRWTAIRPVRQRLKGMSGNKVIGATVGGNSNSNTPTIVYNLFNPEFEGLVDRYTYVCPTNNKIFYKGAEVGYYSAEENVIRLLRRFHYIDNRLSVAYPHCSFLLVEAL